MQQLSDPDPRAPSEAFQIPGPAPQRIRFVRDCFGDLHIEVPGESNRFAPVEEFARGVKYVQQYHVAIEVLETDGPLTIEWDSAAP